MADLDLDAIEAAARAATPGPRFPVLQCGTDDEYMIFDSPGDQDTVGGKSAFGLTWCSHDDARFIAACSPEAILALVAELREARADDPDLDVTDGAREQAEALHARWRDEASVAAALDRFFSDLAAWEELRWWKSRVCSRDDLELAERERDAEREAHAATRAERDARPAITPAQSSEFVFGEWADLENVGVVPADVWRAHLEHAAKRRCGDAG